MQKLNSLREYLVKNIPGIISENLIVFAENGQIVGDSPDCFQYEYDATVILTEQTIDSDELIYPVYCWFLENEPASKSVIEFEVEILDHDGFDIEFKLRLTEKVIRTKKGLLLHCEQKEIEL